MSELQRVAQIPEHIANLLKAIGIDLPDNVKEIQTPTEYSSETNKILLPTGMDKRVAAKELEAQWKNEETTNDFAASFEGWNWQDVLVAIRRVTEREFGWMNGQSTWWSGDPTEIDIVIDIKDGKKVNEKAFFGSFKITGWDNANASINISRTGVASININAKRKFSEVITKYYNMLREQLEKGSIYRGKNISITADANGKLEFNIIENKTNDKIILNRSERLVIDTFIIDSLGEHGKRIYLFTGAYGTGKTETAMQVGKSAVEKHNMSFFYLKDSSVFPQLLVQSKKYQPCVIFLEDIDEIAGGSARDARINKILNDLDGVETKGNDLTVIFTTNHPELINSALRRPGRIDIMVKFANPNEESKIAIYQTYFKNLLGADSLDYANLAKKTPDMQGAVVAEIAIRSVKLAKKYGGITNDLVESAIHSMEYQIELMTEHTKEPSKAEQFYKLFSEMVASKVWTVQEGKDVHNYATN